MTGEQRREDIIERMRKEGRPLSGKELAQIYQVSRQVIVQDIALLRAAGEDILSTNRGYLLESMPPVRHRVLKVNHTEEQLEDELCTVVDLGGCVENVSVNHKVYGELEAGLHIRSRRDVRTFLEDIRKGKSSPLMNLTCQEHCHRIEADKEETLDEIEEALRQKGYLVE